MNIKVYLLILFFSSFLISGSSWGEEKSSHREKPLTHSQLIRLVKGKSDQQITTALVGQKVALRLIATAPDALMVTRGEGIYFICASRANGFSAGMVNGRIVEVETTHEGDLSIVLDRCGR